MAQYSFERIEKKYILTQKQEITLIAELEKHMEREIFGLHSVSNIYYDTPDFELARRSVEKPVYKEKFRLRSYGVPDEKSTVFAEIKKKYRGVVYKRRISGTCSEIDLFMRGRNVAGQSRQIQNELSYFLNQWQPVPAVYIGYDRMALLGREDDGLRVTFDHNLRFRTDKLTLSAGDSGQLILPENPVIMEIKMPAAAPLWLAHLLSENGIAPASFSKYGTYYTTKIPEMICGERMRKIC